MLMLLKLNMNIYVEHVYLGYKIASRKSRIFEIGKLPEMTYI